MTRVVLAVTGVVVIVTIYVATHRPGGVSPPDREPPGATPRPLSEADQVKGRVRQLLAAAARLSPAQGQLRAAAYQQARDLMQAYVTANRPDVEVRPLLGEILLRMGEAQRAQGVAEDLLALRPQSAEALWLKGLALRAQGKPEAEQFLQQAAESPDARAGIWSRYGLELLAQKKFAAARDYLGKAYQAGARDALTLCAMARFALEEGRFPEAELLLAQAVRDETAGPVAWEMLASAQKENGKADEAAASIQEALRLLPARAADPSYRGPDKGDLLIVQGQVRMLQKRWKEAGETFAEAADYPLVRPRATFQAAQCFYLLGRYSLALGYIDAADKLLPGEPAVAEWKKKIEDAHFPRPATATSPFSLP